MRILIVAARHPWPPRRGDQRRPLEVARLLAGDGTGHQVTLLAPRGPGGEGATGGAAENARAREPFAFVDYRRSLGDLVAGSLGALRHGLPLQTALYGSADLARHLRRLAPEHDVVVLTLARLAQHLPDAGTTPVVVDLIDSLALNLARRSTVDRSLLGPLIGLETARLARAETALAARAQRLVVVAERDRREILARLAEVPAPSAAATNGARGAGSSNERIAVIPLSFTPLTPLAAPPGEPLAPGEQDAIEEQPASPRSAVVAHRGEPATSASLGPLVVFTGNLGYFVNDDAARWLCLEVVPRLRRARPELRLLLAGDRPRRSLLHLARRSGVAVIASPPDLAPILRSATVALAPMRAGSGQPIKIMEAWANGVPVVASSWAAAGTTGEAGTDFLVADTPAEWVAAILRLLDTPLLRRRLAEAGRQRLTADYSPRRIARAWEELLHGVVG
jgi:glycosyltransferase involved in cell wall biosynthesis